MARIADHIHVHLHDGKRRSARDAEGTAHDPKSGRFTGNAENHAALKGAGYKHVGLRGSVGSQTNEYHHSKGHVVQSELSGNWRSWRNTPRKHIGGHNVHGSGANSSELKGYLKDHPA